MGTIINTSEVKKHKKCGSAWIIIHNDVYDVTNFLNEHPGGAEVLMEWAGRDGTRAFDDVGHSDDAVKMMEKYKIGSLPPEERKINPTTCLSQKASAAGEASAASLLPGHSRRVYRRVAPKPRGGNWKYILIALALAAAAAAGFAAVKMRG